MVWPIGGEALGVADERRAVPLWLGRVAALCPKDVRF